MAAVSTKTSLCERILKTLVMKEIPNELSIPSQKYFCGHIFSTLLSLVAVIFDICTDLFLVFEYWLLGFKNWSIATAILIVFPSIVVQVFSVRWFFEDGKKTPTIWIIHFCGFGLFYRYLKILLLSVETGRSKDQQSLHEKLHHEQCNVCILHVFEAFLEAAPQLVLQIFIILSLQEIRLLTGLSVLASIGSLCWALTGYSVSQRRARRPEKDQLQWPGIMFQAIWRFGMLSARLSALVLFLFCFHVWFVLFIGIHWFSMLAWILYQKTDLCESLWEERLYNCVAAVIYCFCFFNLKDGRSRWRMLIFYLITVLENMTILTVFLMFLAEESPSYIGMTSFICIVGGTILGALAMITYYRFFHPSGPITLCFSGESNGPSSSNFRSLKCSVKKRETAVQKQINSSESKLVLSESVVVVEESDMEEIRTLQTWLKEAAAEQKIENESQQPIYAATSNTSPTATETETDDVTSSVLSAHDYENLAAVNIARASGLRHWRGYSDIETYLHDDSVVRGSSGVDTRSSTTESSSTQDYLDAIAEEYTGVGESVVGSTGLGTIFEETESTCSESSRSPRASTLVATIDQISRATPVQEVTARTAAHRKFSLIRKRFECNQMDAFSAMPPPPPLSLSPFGKRVCVRDMRALFLRQGQQIAV